MIVKGPFGPAFSKLKRTLLEENAWTICLASRFIKNQVFENGKEAWFWNPRFYQLWVVVRSILFDCISLYYISHPHPPPKKRKEKTATLLVYHLLLLLLLFGPVQFLLDNLGIFLSISTSFHELACLWFLLGACVRVSLIGSALHFLFFLIIRWAALFCCVLF